MAQTTNDVPVYAFLACARHDAALERMANKQGDFWRALAIAEDCDDCITTATVAEDDAQLAPDHRDPFTWDRLHD